MENKDLLDKLVPAAPQEDFHVVIVLDRSGSMSRIQDSVIEATNNFINEQRKEGGNTFVSLIQFDSFYGDPAYWCQPIETVEPLNRDTFKPRGSTALFDAIGKTVDEIKTRREDGSVKGKVQFVVQTDGDDNTSCLHNRDAVTGFVKEVEDAGWGDFIFLGANIDAFGEGSSMGMQHAKTANYSADAGGVRSASLFASAQTKMFRYNDTMDEAVLTDLQKKVEKGEDITSEYTNIDANIKRGG